MRGETEREGRGDRERREGRQREERGEVRGMKKEDVRRNNMTTLCICLNKF